MVAENPLISVLMSTYNETLKELEASVFSILSQTYQNIEFIIVDDNPTNEKLKDFLQSLSDKRIRVFYNENNIGLVASLNKALEQARGEYIVRMDADDISAPMRIEDEFHYLCSNSLDLIGSYIELIDENDNVIKPLMKFPSSERYIRKFIKWGSCLAHPSWFGTKRIFNDLKGYRKAPHCEDYDFLLRALKAGYKIGNIPKIELQYRIRSTGVSRTNQIDQYLLRNYLSVLRNNINQISEEDINYFLHSNTFIVQKERVQKYYRDKTNFKKSDFIRKVLYFIKMISNKYFWKDIEEKVTLYLRER